MDFDANVEFLRLTFYQIILTAGPLLAVALAVGLIIGIVQAATTINEMTLSFVPKLFVSALFGSREMISARRIVGLQFLARSSLICLH